MDTQKVDLFVRQRKMSGYHHVTPGLEYEVLGRLLRGEMDIEEHLTPDILGQHILAADPLRSMKNGVICLVAVICREVIAIGVDYELCYALSDHYIYEVEESSTPGEVTRLTTQLIRHYAKLAQQERRRPYSLPVTRAIQHIRQHLYEPCRLSDIARAVQLNPGYLSALFKKEVGVNIKQFIRQEKLEEARGLLTSREHSITEIAEMLGYSSSSHFARDFNRLYDCSPREFALTQASTRASSHN